MKKKCMFLESQIAKVNMVRMESWVSIAVDRSAPFRLAKANEQRRFADSANGPHKTRTGFRFGQDLRLADFSRELPTRNYRVE
jgi:hypothetical protein